MNNKFLKFKEKMEIEGIDDQVIACFKYLYDKLAAGESGMLSSKEIQKPGNDRIIDYDDLPDGSDAPWNKVAVIKLNGGLGTSMGLKKAKSLLEVKDGKTFLEIIANQIIKQRKALNIDIPLIFMNSFNTSSDTLKFLQKYEELKLDDLPLDFIQNKFPKVVKKTMEPLANKDDQKNWNPPGHGEIYMVLKQSGVLDLLLKKGYRYIFISNSDNLGAIADGRILEYMKYNELPFIMEVCHRTEMDKKGGHLAQDQRGRLILRESAQCPQDEMDQFQDINFFQYFNTNNLWVDLMAIDHKLAENNNVLNLNPIMNHKEVDGVPVVQLETAMGAAISLFERSQAVVVKRNRFIPVKKTNEFLAVRSDAYILDDTWQMKLFSGRDRAPQIKLDDRYYKTISDFEERFISGYPSLIDCEELTVEGNIYFGEQIKLSGKVIIRSDNEALISKINLNDEEKRL